MKSLIHDRVREKATVRACTSHGTTNAGTARATPAAASAASEQLTLTTCLGFAAHLDRDLEVRMLILSTLPLGD